MKETNPQHIVPHRKLIRAGDKNDTFVRFNHAEFILACNKFLEERGVKQPTIRDIAASHYKQHRKK